MNTEKNSLSLSFRSYNDNHDTDMSISVDGDNVDLIKLAKLLTVFLQSIDAKISLNVNA